MTLAPFLHLPLVLISGRDGIKAFGLVCVAFFSNEYQLQLRETGTFSRRSLRQNDSTQRCLVFGKSNTATRPDSQTRALSTNK